MENQADGRKFANQLRRALLNEGGGDSNGSSSTPFSEMLVEEVLMSFTNPLLLLNDPTSESHEVVSDVQQLRDTSMPEDSQISNSKSSIISIVKNEIRNKRRKTSQTWEKESEFPVEDGHQWRKYGQKMILNAQYPRNYYRCTHRNDQGCGARKHVQRIQEDPPLHKTTYCGHHTCTIWQNPKITVDSVSPSELAFDDSERTTSQTREVQSEFPGDDGDQWRKYDQKTIPDAKYPRNYYRCTHKYDQGCRATKHVQRIQEDPPLHRTTYYGHHTCTISQNPDIIVNYFPSPSISSSVTGECKENEIITPSYSYSPNDNYLIPSDEFTLDDDSQRHATPSPTLDDVLYD